MSEGPSILQRALNFVRAAVRHVESGMERRSEEEIERIFNTFCKNCAVFNGTACTHGSCGCSVSDENRFFNKLAWKSESCPAGYWR
ncbi:MAG: hypothetical protein QXG97_05755 [Nitrososphaerota archaeon]